MKPFKILKLIFQVIAATAFLASLVFCALDLTESNTAYMAFMALYGSTFALATIGTFLVSASSDIARRIGHGMMISSYAIGLTAALNYINSSTAALVMLVAVIMLALYYLCALILKIMKKNTDNVENPEDDIRIVRVKEWKKIMEEGIISPDEYEVKRCQILGIKPQEKKTTETKPATHA